MDEQKTLEAAASSLLSLAAQHARNSKKRFLRGVFKQVEDSLKQRVPTKIIVESLNKSGLDITEAYFTSAMSQIRKENGISRAKKTKLTEEGSAVPQVNIQKSTAGENKIVLNQKTAVEPKALITNPADIRKSRRREIDLDNLSDKE